MKSYFVEAIRRERGSMVPLYVLFTMALLGMLTVVMDSTQVYVKQRDLTAIADGASLAAADGIDVEGLYDQGLDADGRVELVRAEAEEAVNSYMGEVGRDRANCYLPEGNGVDGNEVTVVCEKTAELPLVTWMSGGNLGEVELTSTVSAQANTRG